MPTVGVFANIYDEQRRVLCVKRNYGPRNWTTPGGRLEEGESPVEALVREVLEESGYIVQPGRFVGLYAAPHKNDIVLSYEAKIIGRQDWQPDGEISELGFFEPYALPRPINQRALTRIQDAYEGKSGVHLVFGPESDFQYE